VVSGFPAEAAPEPREDGGVETVRTVDEFADPPEQTAGESDDDGDADGTAADDSPPDPRSGSDTAGDRVPAARPARAQASLSLPGSQLNTHGAKSTDMSQSSFDDDALFGEAAEEMRAEVESHLDEARAALPDVDDVWETEAKNVLGVLNGLKSALNAEEAEEALRQAKKQFVVGKRADAFEDADDLQEAIEEVEAVVELLGETNEQAGELVSTLPQLKSSLEDATEDDE
jgi:hypothetical protein